MELTLTRTTRRRGYTEGVLTDENGKHLADTLEPQWRALEEEYARLEQEHEETYAQFKSIRADSQQLWKIKSYVDSARKNLEQLQKHTSHKQEQEI